MDEEPPFDPIALGLKILKEGLAEFYSFPPEDYSDTGTALTKSMPVFYNPIMVINRDVTLLAYKAYQEEWNQYVQDHEFTICDLMAASGIRSIRLLQYLSSPLSIVLNDLNPEALRLIQKNFALNHLQSNFQLANFEALYFLEKSRNEKTLFDVIDIDPFGTPNIFIEPALRAVKIGGILGITATDTAVLFGIKQSACARKYNTRSLRSTFLKEVGIRILLYYSAIRAHPHMLAIEPLFSFSSEHFVRVIIKIHKGKEPVDQNLKHFGYILWCPKCDWRSTHNMDLRDISFECPNCHEKLDYGGPLWLGPLHSKEFLIHCEDILKNTEKTIVPTKKRLEKAFDCMLYEDDFPVGYYQLHKLCDAMDISVGSMTDVVDKIQERGYTANRTHFDPNAIKTSIPIEELREIMQNLSQEWKTNHFEKNI